MTLRAYAKINLLLRILRKRDDGYHELETLFHAVDLFDEIEITVGGSSLRVTSDHPDLSEDETNLCLRAAMLLQKNVKSSSGASIAVRKRVPIGAGLGGGSSDAAAVLKGLNRMWGAGRSAEELQQLGLQLGSDVPYFLLGGTAYATGRGEILTPVDLSLPYWIVLITPPVYISSAWAYSACTPRREPPLGLPALLKGLRDSSREALQSTLVNDFTVPVTASYPRVAEIIQTLLGAGADHAQMSGSGSSVFGLFASHRNAQAAVSQFPPDHVTAITAPSFRPLDQ